MPLPPPPITWTLPLPPPPSPQQAIRASAAAPYYLDDYTVGEERFQDGAAIANNPTLVGIQQVWMQS